MYTEFGFEKNGIEIAAEDEDKEDSDDEDTYYHKVGINQL